MRGDGVSGNACRVVPMWHDRTVRVSEAEGGPWREVVLHEGKLEGHTDMLNSVM